MSSDKETKVDLVNQLTASLHKYGMRTVIFQQGMAQKMGVVYTDLKTAEILNETGPITAGELAKMTGLSTGSVTALIDRLEKEGYVKREKDKSDRRRVMIAPIPERHKEIMNHYQTLSTKTKQFCEDYTNAELAAILNFINGMTEMMEQENREITKSGNS